MNSFDRQFTPRDRVALRDQGYMLIYTTASVPPAQRAFQAATHTQRFIRGAQGATITLVILGAADDQGLRQAMTVPQAQDVDAGWWIGTFEHHVSEGGEVYAQIADTVHDGGFAAR